MGLTTVPGGRGSKYIKNSLLPAKLTMLASQGVQPLSVEFDVVGREGQFTDSTVANYATRGNASLYRFLLNEASKRIPIFLKGELTTKYEGVTPKHVSFDIIFRADVDLKPNEIIEKVKVLQSMCYPRAFIGLNPPLCILHILNLYSLEVYVEQVNVTWHNQWNLQKGSQKDYGLPMGCDINMSVLMHQYPTREEILAGAGFDSTQFMGRGYSGTFQDGQLTLTHSNPAVQKILDRDRAYAEATKAYSSDSAISAQAERQKASNKAGITDPPT